MSRSRHLLHLTKLDEFAKFCESQGWTRVPTKDFYEILRMVKDGRAPLIVHKRAGAKEHGTTWGESQSMYFRYRNAKAAARTAQAVQS